MTSPTPTTFWNLTVEETASKLQTSGAGLAETEVKKRQVTYGLNTIQTNKRSIFFLLWQQLKGNSLLIILVAATLVSFFLGERLSSFYIMAMIFVSISLGFWNEYSAEKTIDSLLKKITQTAVVIRAGSKQEIPVDQLTLGDVVLLSQGSVIPADLRLIETNDLEINESPLTGETKAIYKKNTVITDAHPLLSTLHNIGFMGTSVQSGSGKGLIIGIGKNTEFGKIAKGATFIKPETEFQKGLTKFGRLITNTIIILAVILFSVNALLGHPILDSLLFALAIAVGLTPELLPVIVTISLSHGAGKLAKKHVVVKKLVSLENLGNMDIICTDKTGTLTEGKIDVVDYVNEKTTKDPTVLQAALLANSAVVNHKVSGNTIDVALWEYALKHLIYPIKTKKKIYEEAFDYDRKASFAIIQDAGKTELIAKGSPESILALCEPFAGKKEVEKKILALREEGLRIVLVASKKIPQKSIYSWADMHQLHYVGYITFLDIPKKSAHASLQQLRAINVTAKVITGDSEIVTKKICQEVGMPVDTILTGPEIEKLSKTELQKQVEAADIFARVTPTQKLDIILALQANGHTVGYLGDGINDLPALHNADVGISVNSAVDVAKDAASVVLLRKGIDVIDDGIREGRKTFTNTMKYILMGTSSNFGNMFSAAGASFFLPFLPMTPLQILLNNALYDVSQMTIPSDNVDKASLAKPRHWNIDFIKQYMLFFGPLSSIFDFATFGVLYFFFKAQGPVFQTSWFIESLATQVLVVFVIRTAQKPFYLSNPSTLLTLASIGVVALAIFLPFSPLAQLFGFVTPPPLFFAFLAIIVVTYLFMVEFVKTRFLQKYTL